MSESTERYCMYKYIAPIGIEVVSGSAKNVLACKYIAPMGLKVG